MVTVALIGADGAGKTTVARTLERSQEVPIKYLYMGINAEASNHMLPTTRALRALKHALGRASDQGGPPDPERERARSKKGVRGAVSGFKSGLVLANRLCEEWYRAALARYWERRGYVVLFDRHFYADYHAHDVRRRTAELSLARRIHGRLLAKLPRPDCVILLDAPASVLFARKREGSPELLERRRAEYFALLSELDNCAVVDAARPAGEVVGQVLEIIRTLRGRDGARRAGEGVP